MSRVGPGPEVPAGVSVILPVFLPDASVVALRGLRDSLASVFDQRFDGPLELIVVDDGSPTPVAGFADRLGAAAAAARWLRRDHPGGWAVAVNLGAREARHGLVTHLGIGDRWFAGRLACQVEQLGADPDASLSAAGVAAGADADAGAGAGAVIPPETWSGALRCLARDGCPFPRGGVLARRDIHRLLGGYPRDAPHRDREDQALWAVWLRFFKPATLPRALFEHVPIPQRTRFGAAPESGALAHHASLAAWADELPAAMADLAAALGAPLIDAGRLAYRMWCHPTTAFALPEAAWEPLARLLPDRVLEPDAGPAPPWWQPLDVVGVAADGATRLRAARACPVR